MSLMHRRVTQEPLLQQKHLGLEAPDSAKAWGEWVHGHKFGESVPDIWILKSIIHQELIWVFRLVNHFSENYII